MNQTKICDLSGKSSNASGASVSENKLMETFAGVSENKLMETFAGDFTVSSSCHVEDIPLDLSLLSEEESDQKNDSVESGAEDDLRNLDAMVNFRISDILPTGMRPLDNSINCVIDSDELVVDPSVVSTEYGSSKKSEDFGMFFFRFLLHWKGFVKCHQCRWERCRYRIERLGFRNVQEMQ